MAAQDAGHVLALATALDGLYRREYLGLTQVLLLVAADLLLQEQQAPLPSPDDATPDALAGSGSEPEPPPPSTGGEANAADPIEGEESQDTVPVPAFSRR